MSNLLQWGWDAPTYITYAEMEERANRLAHHLEAHGVGPGDHVGIYAYP